MSEWVLIEYLTEEDDEASPITIWGNTYHPMKKRRVASNHRRTQKQSTEFPSLSAAEQCIKVGDHIWYETRGGIILHHAIVKGILSENENIQFTLIHWKKNATNDFEVVEEMNVNIREKVQSKLINRCNYLDDWVKPDAIELTIARATAWKGRKDYNIFSNNCEHFAIFCKIGCTQSFQQDFIKRMALRILEQACGFTSKFVRVTAAPIGDVTEYFVKGPENFLSIRTQGIGFGVAVCFNGLVLIIDVGRAIYRYYNKSLTYSEFKNNIWLKFMSFLENIFYTGIIPGAFAVGMSLMFPTMGTRASVAVVAVGALVGGYLATRNEGFDQTILGCAMSNSLRIFLEYSDKIVESIDDLHRGDHIVVAKWALHPRCHAIVQHINRNENTMSVVRFTYEKGVVADLLPFKKPVYKVIYNEGACYPPDDVVRRANQRREEGVLKYDILGNNCKSFARWCKTGTLPTSLFAVEGYD